MRRVIRFFILFAVIGLLLCSCRSAYQIAGKTEVSSLDGRTLYLRTLNENMPVDSAWVEHGLFAMGGVADSTMMVTLYLDNEQIMPIVLEDGVISVSITNSQLTASGTPLNDQLYRFIARRNDIERQLSNLDRKEAQMVLDGEDIDKVRLLILQENETLSRQMNDFVSDFIKENYNNVLGPSVFMMMAQSLPYPVMTQEIENVLRDAPNVFRNNPMVTEFLAKARENMKLIEEHQLLRQNVAEKQRMRR